MKKDEFCIMPENLFYETKRFYGSERHEVFEGRTGNREKSIKDGLVIFITPEMHREGKYAVHRNPKFWKETVKIQEIADEKIKIPMLRKNRKLKCISSNRNNII